MGKLVAMICSLVLPSRLVGVNEPLCVYVGKPNPTLSVSVASWTGNDVALEKSISGLVVSGLSFSYLTAGSLDLILL